MTPPHPAKFSAPIIREMGKALERYGIPHTAKVLDPFAGVGGIHLLPYDTVGIELEPEWCAQHERNVQGDATALPFAAETFDVIATSPCYGNRMADHHNARDDSKRHTYRHYLGRPLTEGNSGAMQWGYEYRDLHALAWTEADRVLKVGGLFLLNMSDHIRNGRRVPVTWWHFTMLTAFGFELLEVVPIYTQRQRHGANGNLRVDHESLSIWRKEP